MHVVVIGAGIVGVTTAHALRERGFDVTVLERNAGVAQEVSFANGGLLAADHASPWTGPGLPRMLLRAVLKPGAPMRVAPALDRSLWRWLRRWVRECELERFVRNAARLRRLADYSLPLLHALGERHAIDYERTGGLLQLYRTPQAFERGAQARSVLDAAGAEVRTLTAEQAHALEPALVEGTPLAAALHFPDAETGNCAFFARRLREIAAGNGVVFRCGVQAQRFAVGRGRVEGLQTSEGELRADAYVVAAGVDSARLLEPVSVDVPLLPVLGYSLTAHITRHECAPFMTVLDEGFRVLIARMGSRLRVAGLARFGVRSPPGNARVPRTLVEVARAWFPAAAAFADARTWSGARAMMPDGPPVLGATPLGNLYLNVGHGSAGWLLACGSARIVADVVAGRTPEIDLEGLTMDRFAAGTAV